MFKGLLGKRVPSSEFTIIASPTLDEPGKENVFADDAMPPPSFLPKSRIASGAWKMGKTKPSEEQPTDKAFDKLLVRG
jgi:hypothetical protein